MTGAGLFVLQDFTGSQRAAGARRTASGQPRVQCAAIRARMPSQVFTEIQ